ncbi:DEAD/DEAH box helicase [Roseomonas alkaliterrae]|uniref:Superfamily II DNA or RNA helicase n=1 Tax=Neoroseomonas alkaliterrae TaxID=1452450 RepID=A0A840XT83_9PROT|nr:DEAD/DEAH box helicase family protein [Neoroseomonas alkaliterrae]MBB5691765.1 superfamily II DNA or RNA helicase [Neoroseomonas alkaliterrae]MBR0675606.1 DEAD/DEAH box helicase [Neoroseomonas alkaliterrae]
MQDLAAYLDELCQRTRAGWTANPDLVEVDARREANLLSTGYGDRQIAELVQNAADAAMRSASARIELRLTASHLYAANTGDPVSPEGVRALINGDLSPKGGEEIGRFGLGFRSLLRLGGRVDVHSAGIAFRFDPAWCSAEARRAGGLPPEVPAPGFRLAQRLDAAAERAADPMLAELRGWADTVIRADLAAPDAAEAMRREMDRFPAEFLLFAVPDIQLDLLLPDGARCLRRRRRGALMRLRDGDRASSWRLFQERVTIDDEAARRDAGALQARDAVTITWAVPLRGPRRGGQLWNAFPTRTASVVPGILDTRWKLNSDRTALTGEDWNAALMRRAATLIARSLPALVRNADLGLPLEALPRELERRDEPAAPLHDALWQAVRDIAFLSDGTGGLRRPTELHRPPLDDSTLQERWETVAATEQRAATVHHACISSADRRPRLERLARALRDGGIERDEEGKAEEFHGREEASPEQEMPCLARWAPEHWLAAIADPAPERGREAVLLASDLHSRNELHLHRLRALAIIPTEEGGLASASNMVLPGGAVPRGRKAVHPELVADQAVREALEQVFRIGRMDDAAWRMLLEQTWGANGAPSRQDWGAGWDLLLSAPEPVRRDFVATRADRLRFLTRAGTWCTRDDVLLPGCIVTEEEAQAHAKVLLDPAFADRASSILADLGIGDTPPDERRKEERMGWPAPPWLASLDSDAAAFYRKTQRPATSPQSDTLGYLRPVEHPAGLGLLAKLERGGKARLTQLFLERLRKTPTQKCMVGGRGSEATRNRYLPIPAPDPAAWCLWKEGMVELGGTCVQLADIMALLRALTEEERTAFGSLLPDDVPLRERWVKDWPEPGGSSASAWQALLHPDFGMSPDERRAVWEAAARRGFFPQRVRWRPDASAVPLTEILVSSSADDLALAENAGIPCVVLARDAADAWVKQGARDASKDIETRAIGAPADWIAAGRYIPGLADFIQGEGPAIGFVERVERRLMHVATPGDILTDGDRILVSRSWTEQTPWQEVLRRLLEAVAAVSPLSKPFEELFAKLDRSEADRRRAAVREAADLPHRLLRAVRNPAALMSRLPDAARDALEQEVSDLRLANVFLDVNGSAALRVLTEELRDFGLSPPTRWGTDDARQFVQALGFPVSFAGAARPRLAAEELIPGPQPLPPLHDYQEDVLHELDGLLTSAADRRRAVLSLPTGAGKTRVAVEAAVRAVLSGGGQRPLVLWVAQTEELGEQSVDAFRRVWRAKGSPEADLRVVRLWGGQPTPPEGEPDRPTVVVTLIQTARTRIPQNGLHWLRAARMIIVDESHHGIARSYTEVLDALGVATGQKRSRDQEPVLLGLTATPFRSGDQEESERLAQRFDCRVVPREQAALHQTLRNREFLADVVMEPITFTQPFPLTAEEREHFETFEDLPTSALERLSKQADRNDAIEQAIEQAPERSILLFANSVAHAVALTARLSLRGIRARAVSSETDLSARREAVAAFRRGEVRVVCNAAVFTTGFDAPGVEMILISRPVFSPVRFMQMVGRGLRGPKNGGTSKCRVVTVRDNIDVYRGRDPLEWWRRYYE